MKNMNLTLASIQLTAADLSAFAARRASAQELYSPTAPRPPIAELGWRDRWWLNHTAAQQVALHYWFFDSPAAARTAADEGRARLSTRTVPISTSRSGERSYYQPAPNAEHGLGDIVWQGGANFLFVRHTVVVLVAQVGGEVPVETTRCIARKIFEKIEQAVS